MAATDAGATHSKQEVTMANQKVAEREEQKVRASKEELVDCIAQAMRQDGAANPMQGLHLQRNASPMVSHDLYGPALCMVVQGSKEVLVGDHRYRYDPAQYLLITVELPVVSWVLEASRKQPYLSLHLELDMALVRSLAAEAELPPPHEPTKVKAMNTGPLDAGLLDAMVRFVRLLEAPVEAKVLAPLITREIMYRLLIGKRGSQLRRMADQKGTTYSIARAAERLRKNLDQPLRVEDVARDVGMSVSSFHYHFKAVVGLSPLQFQKRMRLQEARRLMLYEALDAAGAGYHVGYDDAAYFSREYKSLFGVPPKKDVERRREAARTIPT